ncbi:MAG: hypothetical protein IKO14_08775 [Oscillibacter sp.]|nr:hypothetical protein [Oscillibacter sp.]
MKKKKILSLILALAMIFSMSVSVFASGTDTGGTSTNTGGTSTNTGGTSSGSGGASTYGTDFEALASVVVPTINVKVPATQGKLFINPMGFELKIADGAAASAADKADTTIKLSSEKVISPVYMIENESPMKLDVLVNGTAALEGTPTALAIGSVYPFASDNTKNEVVIYAQFLAATEVKAVTDEVRNNASVGNPATYNSKSPADNLFGVGTKAADTAKKVGTMLAATSTSGTLNSGLMYFQFFGDCNPKAKNEWNGGDQMKVSLAFTFQPVTTTT